MTRFQRAVRRELIKGFEIRGWSTRGQDEMIDKFTHLLCRNNYKNWDAGKLADFYFTNMWNKKNVDDIQRAFYMMRY